jgi:hypothetical protein
VNTVAFVGCDVSLGTDLLRPAGRVVESVRSTWVSASQPATQPKNYPHESVEVNEMKWLAQVRQRDCDRTSDRYIRRPYSDNAVARTAAPRHQARAGVATHRQRDARRACSREPPIIQEQVPVAQVAVAVDDSRREEHWEALQPHEQPPAKAVASAVADLVPPSAVAPLLLRAGAVHPAQEADQWGDWRCDLPEH